MIPAAAAQKRKDNSEMGSWAQLQATDETPSSSWGHTASWLGGSSLLLFGGELLTPGPLGSLRADDSAGGARLLRMELAASAEQRWARVPSAEAPTPPFGCKNPSPRTDVTPIAPWPGCFEGSETAGDW